LEGYQYLAIVYDTDISRQGAYKLPHNFSLKELVSRDGHTTGFEHFKQLVENRNKGNESKTFELT
jgi:hypothetical protein